MINEIVFRVSERLIKAARHSVRVSLLACGNALANWERQRLPKLADVTNLTVTTNDPGFLSRLIALLERTITWEITITEGTLYLQIAGELLETPIRVWIAP